MISIVAGCLANHDRAHSPTSSSRRETMVGGSLTRVSTLCVDLGVGGSSHGYLGGYVGQGFRYGSSDFCFSFSVARLLHDIKQWSVTP